MDKILKYLQDKRVEKDISISKKDYYISKLTFIQVEDILDNNQIAFTVLMKMDKIKGWTKTNLLRFLDKKEFLRTYKKVNEEYLKFLLTTMEKLK